MNLKDLLVLLMLSCVGSIPLHLGRKSSNVFTSSVTQHKNLLIQKQHDADQRSDAVNNYARSDAANNYARSGLSSVYPNPSHYQVSKLMGEKERYFLLRLMLLEHYLSLQRKREISEQPTFQQETEKGGLWG